MVFNSIPAAYFDPANWQQQQSNHQTGANTNQFAPPPPPLQPHGSGGVGSIRPGSMADRARMANIPMPEAALKCPRCESANTKFCYFNNYSLSQPRHFCKTCRRYWTRGGALRNVPVGGGCRRNKRSKGSGSKSPVSNNDRPTGSGSTSAMSSNSGATDMLGLGPQASPLRFMSTPLHHLTTEFTGGQNIGLNYGSISAPFVGATNDLNFHIGNALASGSGGGSAAGGSLLSSLTGLDQWRLTQAQQFPFLGGLDSSSSSSGLYPFESGVEPSIYANAEGQLRPRLSSSGFNVSQLASVKMEDNNEMNSSRPFQGIQGNEQYWNTATAWTDLSGFNSSSTSNAL